MTPVRCQPILFSPTTSPTGSSPDYAFDIPTTADCCDVEKWAQTLFTTDSAIFQFNLESCASDTQIVSNPAFIVPGTGWTFFGTATALPGGCWLRNDNDAAAQFSLSATHLQWYQIDVVIAIGNIDQLVPADIVITGFEQAISISASSGQYRIFAQKDSTTDISVSRQNTSASNQITEVIVSQLSVREITIPDVIPTDINGEQISTNGAIVEFNQSGIGQFTFPLESEEIAEQCIRLAVYRDCETPYISEVIEIKESNDCTLLIGGCGDANFQESDLRARLEGFYTQDQAPEFDRFTTVDSKGTWRNNYTRMVRMYSLYLERVPAHVRDWLYWLTGSNTIGIKKAGESQVDFFVHQEPEAATFADRDYGLGSMRMTITPKTELNEHIYRSDCSPNLPPIALGSSSLGIAIEADADTAINAE